MMRWRGLVCFNKPEVIDGRQAFGNDPLPATITEEGNAWVSVRWDNGFSVKSHIRELQFYNVTALQEVAI